MANSRSCASRLCDSRRRFFCNDTPTPEIYPLSLHDALPISEVDVVAIDERLDRDRTGFGRFGVERAGAISIRSEEHTSELQSQFHLVCRLLLEKKKSFEAVPFLQEHRTTTSYRLSAFPYRSD